MPRPKKCRMIETLPGATYFKPRGIPMKELTEVYLPMEGLESLRLTDVERYDQETAAQMMGISRQTFGRILTQARHVVSKALVFGMALCIQGGDYRLAQSKENFNQPAKTKEKSADDNVTDE